MNDDHMVDELAQQFDALLHEAQLDANQAAREGRARKFSARVNEILACETLRQMAWARLEGIGEIESVKAHNQRVLGAGGGKYRDISLTGDLTLAPPDWKPPA